MSKLKKLIKSLLLLIKKPSLINEILTSNVTWQMYLSENHPNLQQLKTIEFTDIVTSELQLDTFSFLGGGSLPTDILLLKQMCLNFTNCSYFEIGTWRGESVINIVENTNSCYTLNLSKQEIIDLGLSKKYAELHGFYSKKHPKINHLYGNSKTFDFNGLQKFDVVFIDGNHTYEFVKNNTQKVFKHLVKETSVVIWHDYMITPENVRPEVLSGILDGLPEEEYNYLYHVSNTLCAIYTKEKFNSELIDFPIKPKNKFQIKIK